MKFNAVDTKLLFTKNDPADVRIGEWVTPFALHPDDIQPNSAGLFVVGYPDDAGISANGGRPGAKEAPDRIRRSFYKMTPRFDYQMPIKVFDIGNLHLATSLPQRHEDALNCTRILHKKNAPILSFGGGHDYGYPDVAGFLHHWISKSNVKPLVLNFDAHLDVRPVVTDYHSGTPFFRLLREFQGQFEFFEIGLQPQCNSPHHAQWLRQMGGTAIWMEDFKPGTLRANLENQLKIFSGRPTFVSFDMDVLSSTIAPGCSQSWAGGLSLFDAQDTLRWIYDHFAVKGLGIYEVSPPLDRDDQTSKAAALLAHQFLFATGRERD